MLSIKLALLGIAGSLTLTYASPVNGYTVSDCGFTGSTEYQDCQTRMAVAESAYLATHVPAGILWDSSFLASLPPLAEPLRRYFVLSESEDSRWVIVGNHDDDTDSFPAYAWHDGIFTPADNLPRVDVTGLDGWISINDQGTIADAKGGELMWFSPLGFLEHPAPDRGSLNDANQLLFTYGGTGWVNYLYAPTLTASLTISDGPDRGATVPEPSGLLLAGLGLAALVGARCRKSLIWPIHVSSFRGCE